MKTVQLIGTLPEGLPRVPRERGTAERWMFNEPKRYPPDLRGTWTRWFDTHSNAHIEARHPSFQEWAMEQDGERPIYTLEPNPWPAWRRFPGQEIMTALQDDYFTHQASWTVAYAIWLQRFDRLEFHAFSFGVGGVNNWKYAFERPCIHYWIGRAKQAGMEVILPPEAKLCAKKFIYGYEGPSLP